MIVGIPTVNYFDEIGPMSKSSISDESLGAFSDFFRIYAAIAKGEKTGICLHLTFLGLAGRFPGPENEMAPRLIWRMRGISTGCQTRGIPSDWPRPPQGTRIPHRAFVIYANFGLWRFGRGKTPPLNPITNAVPRRPAISDSDRMVFGSCASLLMGPQPCRVISRNPVHDKNHLYGCARGDRNPGNRRICRTRRRRRG